MKKNWIAAIIILLAIGGTLTVLKMGVKKAVDSSLNTDHSQPNQSGEAANREKNDSKTSVSETGSNGQSTSEPGKQDGVKAGGETAGSHSDHATTQTASTSGTSTSASTEVKKAPPAENNCFAFEYRHTKDAQNKDIEDFLDYSNAFPILHKNLNEKSVCVKVNNKPVAFKMNKYKSQDEVMIGAVVGPESVIRVSYCVGKAACKEACAVKSNRFMDDMMSDAGDDDEFKDSWGDSNSAARTAQKKELQGKVKELRSIASENKDLAQRSVVRNWDTIEKQEWVCKK